MDTDTLFSILAHLNKSGQKQVKFTDIKNFMKGYGDPQFNHEVFKNLYDENPKIQNIVKDFDNQSITFASGSVDKIQKQNKPGRKSKESEVSKMAKRATKI